MPLQLVLVRLNGDELADVAWQWWCQVLLAATSRMVSVALLRIVVVACDGGDYAVRRIESTEGHGVDVSPALVVPRWLSICSRGF